VEKLLTTLDKVPDAPRSARFYCALVYLRHAADPTPLICEGSWQGFITQTPQGTGGFGYDPIFFVTSEGKTAAQLRPELKNRLSHRGQALAQWLSRWRRV
jgi:XTP/dITP diphosphohydrolase